MANPYASCRSCSGNQWPPGQVKEHSHIDTSARLPLEWPNNPILKKKYKVKPRGWNKVANPRTNSASGKVKTLAPRKRAYGPF